jgi:formylglycine-generating enzyme required for sulfatase activity
VTGVSNWPPAQMVAIPPGHFLMGSALNEPGALTTEFPQHPVQIDYVLAIAQHTVTFEEWDAAKSAGAAIEYMPDRGWGRIDRPVIYASKHDAQAYLRWLNEVTRLTGCADSYRLPSEAEWEYACRAGAITRFTFGDTISTIDANFDYTQSSNSKCKGEYRARTMAVDSFDANAFGIRNMHGNVWEWCQDNWKSHYYGSHSNGSPWMGGDAIYGVVRGGSWNDTPFWVRSAARIKVYSSTKVGSLGFRIARTLLP